MQYKTYDEENHVKHANHAKKYDINKQNKAEFWQRGDRLFKEVSPLGQKVTLQQSHRPSHASYTISKSI